MEEKKIRIMNITLRFCIWVIWAMSLIIILTFGPSIERNLHPVVIEFDIRKSWVENGEYFISGTMIKERSECNPKEVNMFAGGGFSDMNSKSIKIDFNPDKYHEGKNKDKVLRTRPSGPQHWGPWKLTPPEEPFGPYITITSLHDCHILWDVSSILDVINSKDIFPDKLLDE